MKRMSLEEKIEYRKANYPKACADCEGPLTGPGTDEEIAKQIKEHDRLFGEAAPITTSVVVCDKCFQDLCPNGELRK